MICTQAQGNCPRDAYRLPKFQQKNEDSEPLFDEVDLERTLFHLETEPIGHDFEPLPV